MQIIYNRTILCLFSKTEIIECLTDFQKNHSSPIISAVAVCVGTVYVCHQRCIANIHVEAF